AGLAQVGVIRNPVLTGRDPHDPARLVAGLQHDDLATTSPGDSRGDKAGEAAAHHDHVGLAVPRGRRVLISCACHVVDQSLRQVGCQPEKPPYWLRKKSNGSDPGPSPTYSGRPVTMSWSPPASTDSRRHSICAITPDRIGAPVMPGDQPTPSNLSPPDTANLRQIASWSAARMLTANVPTARMRGQVCDECAGQNITS